MEKLETTEFLVINTKLIYKTNYNSKKKNQYFHNPQRSKISLPSLNGERNETVSF